MQRAHLRIERENKGERKGKKAARGDDEIEKRMMQRGLPLAVTAEVSAKASLRVCVCLLHSQLICSHLRVFLHAVVTGHARSFALFAKKINRKSRFLLVGALYIFL
jgi:hypothetical protein